MADCGLRNGKTQTQPMFLIRNPQSEIRNYFAAICVLMNSTSDGIASTISSRAAS